jgi:hypothetical protein
MARGQTRRKGAQGQGETGPKEGVLMPGEWQEPQRWASSTRNRLQLKESRKADAAVKWPRWLPCRHAPEKSAVLRSSCSFFSQLPADPRHCKALSKLWAREPHICLDCRVNLDNHHTHPYKVLGGLESTTSVQLKMSSRDLSKTAGRTPIFEARIVIYDQIWV